MSEQEAFLAAIRADPDDDGPRLVFADWLEERNPVWAAYIRDECAAARPGDRPDSPRLRRRFDDPVVAAIRELRKETSVPGLADLTFKRGFVEGVRFWRLDDAPAQLEALHRSPLVSVVTEFTIGADDSNDEQAALALQSPWMRRLRTLTLQGYRLSSAVARAIAESPHLTRLRRLQIDWTPLGEEGLRALGAASALATVEELALFANGAGDAGVGALVRSPNFRRVRTLSLPRNDLTAAGVRAMGASENFRSVVELHLQENAIDDEGFAALFASPHFAVERLFATATRFGDDAAAALARSPAAASLRCLKLGGNRMGDRGAIALAESPRLGGLEELDVRNNHFEREGRLALVRARAFPNLTRLSLSGLTEEAAAALLDDPGPPRLASLDLHYPAVRPATLAALARRYKLGRE